MNAAGVWFGMFINARAGAEVMGHFQLIMSVCMFGTTFAVSGVNFAAMRLVAEGLGDKGRGNCKKIMKKCFLYSLCFGVTAGMLLYGFSGVVSEKWLNYREAESCLRVFAFCLPFVSTASAVSGYFTAMRRGYKDSMVRISGQLVKIASAFLIFARSPKNPCMAVMLSVIISEIFGAVISFLLYVSDKNNSGELAKTGKILPIALPIAFSTYLRTGLMTVKNLMVPMGLMKFGMTKGSAAASFGLIHGIALPAVLFPSSFLFSFSALAVPELSRANSQEKTIKGSKKITYMINRSVQLTLLFSVAASGFMFAYAKDIADVLGGGKEVLGYIKALALLIPVMYLDNTVDNMLKGLNEQVSSMKFNIIDSSVSLLLVILLLPKVGPYGYVFIICLGEIMNFAMSFSRLIQISSVKVCLVKHFFMPIIAISAVCILFMPVHINIWLKAISAVLLYYILCVNMGSFSKDDRIWLRDIFHTGNTKAEVIK